MSWFPSYRQVRNYVLHGCCVSLVSARVTSDYFVRDDWAAEWPHYCSISCKGFPGEGCTLRLSTQSSDQAVPEARGCGKGNFAHKILLRDSPLSEIFKVMEMTIPWQYVAFDLLEESREDDFSGRESDSWVSSGDFGWFCWRFRYFFRWHCHLQHGGKEPDAGYSKSGRTGAARCRFSFYGRENGRAG